MNIKEHMHTFKEEFDPLFENTIIALLNEQSSFSSPLEHDTLVRDGILNYARGGKRIRPFLSYYFSGQEVDNAELKKLMLALELFHLAALIHDDIIDQSDERRSSPTVHTLFNKEQQRNKDMGSDIALLYGDMFLTASLRETASLPSPLFNNFSTMIQRTIRGQVIDTYHADKEINAISKRELFERHRLKTAWYTFVSPVMMSLQHFQKLSSQEAHKMNEVLSAIGLLYQIRDDIIDTFPDSGKKRFNDFKEQQTTWLSYHLEEHHPRVFEAIFHDKLSDDEIAMCLEKVDLLTPYHKEFKRVEQQLQATVFSSDGTKERLFEVLSLLNLN